MYELAEFNEWFNRHSATLAKVYPNMTMQDLQRACLIAWFK